MQDMTLQEIRVRAETAHDLSAIDRVTAAAFLDARHSSGTEQFIVAALRRAGMLAISRVAAQGDEIVGHVAVSPVQISGKQLGWYRLGPLSVAPSHQRRGIGSALVMDALLALSDSGAAGCVVLGDPLYYERFGFKATGSPTLPGVPPEHFLSVAFDPEVPSGAVSYHEAFHARS
jgi:putative acetyltransferase